MHLILIEHVDVLPYGGGGSYATINSDAEAENLTEDWTVPNEAIDLSIVPLYLGSRAGLSPGDGPCDKNVKGMNGAVAEITNPVSAPGRTHRSAPTWRV